MISIDLSCFLCRNIKLIYFLPRRGQTAVFASTAPWKYWLWTATWLAWSGSQTRYFVTQRQRRLTGSPPPTSSSAYGMMARSCTPSGEHLARCRAEGFSHLWCSSSNFQQYLCSPLLFSSQCLPGHALHVFNYSRISSSKFKKKILVFLRKKPWEIGNRSVYIVRVGLFSACNKIRNM